MPPTAVKDSPAMPKAREGSILARAVPVTKMVTAPIKMSVYGKPKTGKTRFAATFPKPLLIVGAEDGTDSVKNKEGVTFLRVLTAKEKPPRESGAAFVRVDELPHLFAELADTGAYKTVVLDTANRLQDVNLANIMGLERTPEKGLGKAGKEQYILNSYQTKSLLSGILRLPCNVVVLSHEKDFNREGDSEVRTPSISSAVSDAVERLLNGDLSYVCQTFIRDEVAVTKEKHAGKEVEVETKTGKAEYCLRLGNHPHYVTGFRVPDGCTFPDVLPNPTYEKIAKLISGK